LIVYKTTNNINGKIYVGKDARNRDSYLGSGKVFKLAVAKYGKENFTKTIIDKAESLDELAKKENFWVSFLDARNPDVGYNRAEGGVGGGGNGSGWKKGKKHTEETREKMSKTHQILAKDVEYINKLRKAKIGVTKSEETKRRMSICKQGDLNPMSAKRRAERRCEN